MISSFDYFLEVDSIRIYLGIRWYAQPRFGHRPVDPWHPGRRPCA